MMTAISQDRLSLLIFSCVEGRGRYIDDQIDLLFSEKGIQPFQIPDIFTDRYGDSQLFFFNDDRLLPRRKITLLIEDAIIRKHPFSPSEVL